MIEVYFISDLHIPYEDKVAVKKALADIKKNKPELVVLGGDIIDFYQISRFDKDPERIGNLQNELNQYYKFMDKLRTVYKGKLVYLIGNHETRLRKYLIRNPELYGLDYLKLDYMLQSDYYKFELCYEYKYKDIVFTHGIKVNKYCASGELDRNGINGCSGHKHNHNVASKTNRTGSYVWITAPCMCDYLGQDYVVNPDWQTGYIKLKFDTTKLIGYEGVLL